MVSEGPITFLWVLTLQITSRVANVDDSSLIYNRPSQKIIGEMHAQLAIYLPFQYISSAMWLIQAVNNTELLFLSARWFTAAKFPAISLQVIPINCSEKNNKRKKKLIVNHSILSSWKERKSKLMVLITLSGRQLISNISRNLQHQVLDPRIFHSILCCITSYLGYMSGLSFSLFFFALPLNLLNSVSFMMGD